MKRSVLLVLVLLPALVQAQTPEYDDVPPRPPRTAHKKADKKPAPAPAQAAPARLAPGVQAAPVVPPAPVTVPVEATSAVPPAPASKAAIAKPPRPPSRTVASPTPAAATPAVPTAPASPPAASAPPAASSESTPATPPASATAPAPVTARAQPFPSVVAPSQSVAPPTSPSSLHPEAPVASGEAPAAIAPPPESPGYPAASPGYPQPGEDPQGAPAPYFPPGTANAPPVNPAYDPSQAGPQPEAPYNNDPPAYGQPGETQPYLAPGYGGAPSPAPYDPQTQYPPTYPTPQTQDFPPGYPASQNYPQGDPGAPLGYPAPAAGAQTGVPEPASEKPAVPAEAVSHEAVIPASTATLTLTTGNEAARAAAMACVEAIEHAHLDAARSRCGEALKQDERLAMAHLWLAQAAATPVQAATELAKASEYAAQATVGERMFITAYRNWREARLSEASQAYNELVFALGGEKRAYAARGQFRQTARGELSGAIEDYRKVLELDPKYAAGHNLLGFALADAGQLDEATQAIQRYIELMPSEPNAHDSLAALALRRGDLAEAAAEERKALNIDPRFLIAHATLGDALLLGGKIKEARREYALLEAATEPMWRHEGALRAARSHLFEGKNADAELALVKEADWARRHDQPGVAAATFLEVARMQIERGALTEAARGLREADQSLMPPTPAVKPFAAGAPAETSAAVTPPANVVTVSALELQRLNVITVEQRALLLASIGERSLAEARLEELGRLLRRLSDPQTDARLRSLRGWIAWRNGADQVALAELEPATLPTMRYAYALALARSGERTRARVVMEALARGMANDLETALTRPRALTWLRNDTSTPAAASATTTAARP